MPPDTPYPVSYTHLDVYKRQTVYRYAEDAAPIIFPFHSPVSAGLYPDLEILISSLLKDM